MLQSSKLYVVRVAILFVLGVLSITMLGQRSIAPTPATGQEAGFGSDLFPNFSLGEFGNDTDDEPAVWTARYFAAADGNGRLEIQAELADAWHVYSTTQPAGGPIRTKFSVIEPEEVSITGNFTPDTPPTKAVSSQYNGLTVEEHDGTVVWTAPIKVPAGFEASITVKVKALVCKNSCLPVNEELVADYAGVAVPQGPNPIATVAMADRSVASGVGPVAKPFRDKDYVVQWIASLTPANVAVGGRATLTFTANPDATFHVYKETTDDADSATNFVVTEKSGLKVGPPTGDKPVVSKSIVPSLPAVHYYAGKVTWTLPVDVPANLEPGEKTIEGMIGYQACTDNSCHQPVALSFKAKLVVGDKDGGTAAAVELASAKSATAKDAAAELDWVDDVPLEKSDSKQTSPSKSDTSDDNALIPATVKTTSPISFPGVLGLALIGGVILNFMPCVLPVVGLKIMGFVSQAGEDRRRVLLLNFVYALGILSVFALLAVLAIVFKFGWGQQFTYFPVRLGLTLLLFALALSYLGVWEIPAPGMASSKTSQQLQNREGLVGAFSKGVFATILATPCSGPLLGYILGLTLGLSSLQTAAIFLAVGIGMAVPYLIIGMQPKLISWLPKPGAWMETFKQLMAFLFLGTVAFFFAQFTDAQKLPVFVSLLGVWFGCWVIGQVPNWADLSKRLTAWGGGIIAAAVISIAAFQYLMPGPKVLAWEDYSEPRLQQLQSQGKTVLLDFSAKWCVNCIYNYEVAINTEKTRQLVDELGAVALYADYTDFDPAIKSKLAELESRSIPLLAIYPGGRPGEPIILRDLVTQQSVLDALAKAGESMDLLTATKPTSTHALVSSGQSN